MLDHNYLPVFDNLSSLPGWASDMLCRAATGGAYSKRELYSDDEDVCYSFLRPYLLNGISCCATRPDLLDRSILIELTRIPDDRRRLEGDLFQEWDSVRPGIFGAVLDALVYAWAGASPMWRWFPRFGSVTGVNGGSL
jgi:hypothetical protein